MIPHCTPAPWPQGIPSTRMAASIARGVDPSEATVALIGLADDEGVRLNHGRIGARDGPDAFRHALSRLGAAEADAPAWPSVYDAGNIGPGTDLQDTHNRVTEAVAAVVELGLLPVAIGGGHDLTYPFVRAVADRYGPMTGVYFDPHLDVRDTPGSGMSFRRLIETGAATGLFIHGYDPFVNTRESKRWFDAHNGHVEAFGPGDPWPAGDRFFVSFDLDAVDQAYAPGVSAPNPSGMDPKEAAAWARAAGKNPRVMCIDIMELSPQHDQPPGDGSTARLAAYLFLSFLRGLAERPAGDA